MGRGLLALSSRLASGGVLLVRLSLNLLPMAKAAAAARQPQLVFRLDRREGSARLLALRIGRVKPRFEDSPAIWPNELEYLLPLGDDAASMQEAMSVTVGDGRLFQPFRLVISTMNGSGNVVPSPGSYTGFASRTP